MEDDLTPNDSEALGVYEPEEPIEVKQKDQKEVNRVAIAKAVADDVINWFDSMLDDYSSVDALKKTMNTYKLTAEESLAVHHQISAEIVNMLTKFKDRFTRPEDHENE